MAYKNKSLKIGFDATWLAQTNKSGIGYYLEYLIKALAEYYSDEIELIGYVPRGFPKLDLPKAQNLKYKTATPLSLKAINLLRRFGIEIAFELLIGQRVDFILFPSYITYPSLLGTPSAVVIHDLAYIDEPDTVSARNRKDLIKNVPRSIKRSNFIITISDWTKKRLGDVYKINKPILITHVPLVESTEPKNIDSILKNLGITKPYILFIGTLEPRKNIVGLLDAYEKLPKDTRDKYSLVLAGGRGWNDDEIETKLKSAHSKGLSVIVPGYISDEQKSALLNKASLFVMPSFYEGFGMPLLEAMSYKVPVAASDIEVFHEVCGPAAVYFNPKNSADIAKEIQNIIDNDDRKQQLIEAGKKNLERFSWQRVADQLMAEIKKTIS